jgi:hypothetical protein
MRRTYLCLSQACIRLRTQLLVHAPASVETCEAIETRASFPENMNVAVEVHPSKAFTAESVNSTLMTASGGGGARQRNAHCNRIG